MNRHRFLELVAERRLPQPTQATLRAAAFVACPLARIFGWSEAMCAWQQQVYQLAFQQAQAVVRPSLPERDLAGVWN